MRVGGKQLQDWDGGGGKDGVKKQIRNENGA